MHTALWLQIVRHNINEKVRRPSLALVSVQVRGATASRKLIGAEKRFNLSVQHAALI